MDEADLKRAMRRVLAESYTAEVDALRAELAERDATIAELRAKLSAEALLTPKEVADRAGVCLETVYRWVRSKRLPHGRPGGKNVRVRRGDLEAFLADNAA